MTHNAVCNFSDARLPENFSLGATGGPEYATNILRSASGSEQRNINHCLGRLRYDLAPSISDEKSLQKIVSFFRAHRGRAIAFRMKDWSDYRAHKELIGIGDGQRQEFQLTKSYIENDAQFARAITKPIKGSILIFADDVLTSAAIDCNKGIMRFDVAPATGVRICASFEFDVPVRFDTDFLEINLEMIAKRQVVIPVIEVV